MACRRRSSQPIRFRTEQQHDCMGRRHLLGALLLPARRTAVPPCPLRRLLHSSAERPTLPRAKQKQGILAYRAGRMHQNTRVTLTRAEVPPPPPPKDLSTLAPGGSSPRAACRRRGPTPAEHRLRPIDSLRHAVERDEHQRGSAWRCTCGVRTCPRAPRHGVAVAPAALRAEPLKTK